METPKFHKHAVPRTPKNKSSRNQTNQQSPKRSSSNRHKNSPHTPTRNLNSNGDNYTNSQNLQSVKSRSISPSSYYGNQYSYGSPYSSDSDSFEAATPPRESFLSDSIYRKQKSGLSPRGVSRETTPDLLSEEDIFISRTPQRNGKNGLYAGPTFSNAPTPDTLPVPVFMGRSPSPPSSVYNLSPSNHTTAELGLNTQFSSNVPYHQSNVNDCDLRLRSQKLLSLLNGGHTASPEVYNPVSCYPGVHPSYGQHYQPYNFPLY
ncbi:hypothetical protein K7432_006845 [Basidiobolus ranarum]|uniref:Uncharacterized protein n=1 Tax=Basidiobolus ranarum TaxID=34480 RepID=A0ABR2W115_9FUNG